MNVTRNALWLLGCRVCGDLLNLAFFVVISRTFGPGGVGSYSYGFAVTGFVLVIGAMGIEEYGLREYARMAVERRPAFIAELLGTQTVTVLAALAGVGTYLLYTSPSMAMLRIMMALSFYQVAQALSAVLFIPAMGEQQMIGRAVGDLLCRVVSFLFTGLAILMWHAPISWALMGYVPAAVVLIAVSARSARRYGGPLRLSMSAAALRTTTAVLWSFAAVDVLAQLFAKVGVIVLSLQRGETAAGVYATGLRMIEAGLMPTAFVGIAVYPQLSRLFRQDSAVFQTVAFRFMGFVTLTGVLLTWGLCFVAPPLLVPILGPRYAGTEPVIMGMAALALLQALEMGFGRILFSADRQVGRAVGVCLGALGALLLNVLLVPRYGIDGAIVAGVVSYLAINAAYVSCLREPLRAARLLPWLLALVCACVGAAAVAWWLSLRGETSWQQALGSAAAFLLFAAAASWGVGGRPLAGDGPIRVR